MAGLATLIAMAAALTGPLYSVQPGGGAAPSEAAAQSSLGALRSIVSRNAGEAASMIAASGSSRGAPSRQATLRSAAPTSPRPVVLSAPPDARTLPGPAVVGPAPASPTRFEAGTNAGGVLEPLARERIVREVHSTATPGLQPGDQVAATVSFYYCASGSGPAGDGGDFCGAMRDGTVVYPGAAACDYAYLGQRFRVEGDPTGRVYTCNDTGNAVHGLHRDIWFPTSDEGWRWQRAVGRRVVIQIVN